MTTDIEAKVRADLEGAHKNIAQANENLAELEKARVAYVSERDQYRGVADYCRHLLEFMHQTPVPANPTPEEEKAQADEVDQVQLRAPAGAEEDAEAMHNQAEVTAAVNRIVALGEPAEADNGWGESSA